MRIGLSIAAVLLVSQSHAKQEVEFRGPAANKLELGGDWVHSCGNVLLNVTNFGVLGSMPGSRFPFSDASSFQWPAGSGVEYLWAAGLWVGALQHGVPRVSTGLSDFSEFRPGRSELDRIRHVREGSEGGLRFPATGFDDDRDGRADEDAPDGRDNDGDGRIDEDFAAISNQMFYCEYNDWDPGIRLALPEHVPLEILVQQTSLCWGSSNLNDFIGLDFGIVNRGVDPLLQVYTGLFADFDLGPRGHQGSSQDDRAGFWEGAVTLREIGRQVQVSIGYMFDEDGDRGETEGYVGLVFLGGRDRTHPLRPRVALRNFRMFVGNTTFEIGGVPRYDAERYQVLEGTAPRSLPEVGRGPQLAQTPGDYSVLISLGPFPALDPGDTLRFQAALVAGRFFDGLIQNAARAQLAHEGLYLNCDRDVSTGWQGRETPVCGPEFTGLEFRIDPCDPECRMARRGDPNCFVRVPQEGCVWVNADCEEEQQSGVRTGIGGRECAVHWIVDTAPPPPHMRLVPHQDRIDVLWDNESEFTADPISNRFDFESYRIWRADQWTRPQGTSTRTGPSPTLWSLVDEFDQPQNGVGADRGLESIRYRPALPTHVVEFYARWDQEHPLEEPPLLAGLTDAQQDTARALARGVRYYRYVDPPFLSRGRTGAPCPLQGPCPELSTPEGPVHTRCNPDGICQETHPPPHSGAHYFYAVTATDHQFRIRFGRLVPSAPGLAGSPASNFVYVRPPTEALAPERYGEAQHEIRVVPNPATRSSMAAWELSPNNQDPSGVKIEFHHLPRTRGKVTIYTLAGDRVQELGFDGSSGQGTLAWNLVSRNGQDVTSGVYLYTVEAEDPRFERLVGRFVVIR